MVVAIPNTGSTIKMGGVWKAYYNSNPAPNAPKLNKDLGSKIGISASAQTLLSRSFGGIIGPYDYL